MIVCLGTTPTVQRSMIFRGLRIDAVNRALAVRQFASGKSINAARVLHALGHSHLALGFVGGDSGRFIREDLDRAGIRCDFVPVEPSTRLCVTLIDEAQHTATELVEESRPVAAEDYRKLLQRLTAALAQATALVLSGTLPPGAPQGFYADCIALAGPAIPVIVDASGAALSAALPRRPAVVKINRLELSFTLEAAVDDEEAVRGALRQVVARGARWAIATAGAEASYITDGQEMWRVRPPRVPVVSPIGSGDAFAAALALGAARGQAIPQACVLATACAAANAMTLDAGHVHPGDVDALLGQVRIERL